VANREAALVASASMSPQEPSRNRTDETPRASVAAVRGGASLAPIGSEAAKECGKMSCGHADVAITLT